MKSSFKSFISIVSASPVLFLIGLVISYLLYKLIPATLYPMNTVWVTELGAVVIVIGTLLAIWAQKISRVVSHPKYTATCQDLMQGPYRFSRHPGSMSLIIMYAGFMLVVNSLMMLLLLIVLIALLSFWFVPLEERAIAEQCPDAYTEYKKRVRMWL